MLTVGDRFPPFSLAAVKPGPEGLGGPNSSFVEIADTDFAGKWKVVFFWPKDFTFVCPTEIAAFGALTGAFAERDAVLLGISTDSEYAHLNWRMHNDDLFDLPIAMLSDIKRELSTALGILDRESGVALRATFLIDRQGIIQWVEANGLNVGRNPEEVLRVLDALQTKEPCPCSWKRGQPTLAPQTVFEKHR